MGIVIRPAPHIFQRALPLVVVFGAYRRYPRAALLDLAAMQTIEEGVALARRVHAPLAFCREVTAQDEPGVWLPGCRPRVSDRVFDTAPGSACAHREFASVLLGLGDRALALLGPEDDSSLAATAADAARSGHPVLRIRPGEALQNRSTADAAALDAGALAGNHGRVRTISLGAWANNLLVSEGEAVPA